MANSYLLIIARYVTLIRNCYDINFISTDYCINNINISTGYFSNIDQNDITLSHPHDNHDQFVEELFLCYTINSFTCSIWQSILLLRLPDTTNMIIQNRNGVSSDYVIVYSHVLYILNNVSWLNVEDEMIIMYLGFNHSINELIEHNEGLFMTHVQHGSKKKKKNNTFHFSLHLYSVNESDASIVSSDTCKILIFRKDSDRTGISSHKILINHITLKNNTDWSQVIIILASNTTNNFHVAVTSGIFSTLIGLIFVISSTYTQYAGEHNKNNMNTFSRKSRFIVLNNYKYSALCFKVYFAASNIFEIILSSDLTYIQHLHKQ